MSNSFIYWNPLKGIKSSDYRFDSTTHKSNLLTNHSEFYITLQHIASPDQRIQIRYKYSVDIQKVTKRSLAGDSISNLKSQRGNTFDEEQIAFKTHDSPFLRWITDQSHGIRETTANTHFSFITSDMIIDVITSYDPEINMISVVNQTKLNY